MHSLTLGVVLASKMLCDQRLEALPQLNAVRRRWLFDERNHQRGLKHYHNGKR